MLFPASHVAVRTILFVRHLPMTFSPENPFTGPVPKTVHLTDAPLTSVLVQVAFPEIFSITKTDFIGDFQESIRADYPYHRLEQTPVVELELNSSSFRQDLMSNWRFYDKDEQWRLSLSTGFFALETRAYKGRSDFVHRIDKVVRCLSAKRLPKLSLLCLQFCRVCPLSQSPLHCALCPENGKSYNDRRTSLRS